MPPGAASFPGQNGKIVFTRQPLVTPGSTAVGGADIFVMEPDGSNQVSLEAANSTADDRDPAWSADGTRLAFASNRSGNYEIYTARADGTDVVRLTNDASSSTVAPPSDRYPAWSPAGDRIVFSRNNNLAVMGANGAGRLALTGDGAGFFNANPSWSPDGKRIAFQRLTANVESSDIFVVDADGSNLRNLTQTSLQDETEPSWSPDGARITFSRDFDIYVMDADGTDVVPVTKDKATNLDREPSWSPDGSRIVFRSELNDSADGSRIFAIAPNGSGRAPLTSPKPASDLEPDWQPLPLGTAVAPNSLDFGTLTVGDTSAPQSVTMTNTGLGVLQVGTVVVGGVAPGDFLKGPDTCGGESRPAGATCQITFRFRPTAIGPRSATVTITDSAPGSPRTVSLRGRGVEPTTITTATTAPEPEPGTATLDLVPPVGPPGFVTLAVGRGFPPGTTVRLRWQPGLGETGAVADAAGTFRVPVLVFHRDVLGSRQLVASLVSGQPFAPDPLGAPFLVVAATVQPGDFVTRR